MEIQRNINRGLDLKRLIIYLAGWSKVKTYMGREDNLIIKWISEKHILGILKGNIFVR